MKIELHILQNFAPSNLNRDDTGAPKSCELGGWPRARISSQSQKRAVRERFRLDGVLAKDDLATRTKRLIHRVAECLSNEHGVDAALASALTIAAVEGVGLKRNKKKSEDPTDLWKTEYLLFVPRRIVDKLAKLIFEQREALEPLAVLDEGEGDKKKKAKKKPAMPKELKKELEALFADTQSTVDLALFGRMIADRPAWNVEASCQVAHAISTHALHSDFDFFTAVDDFKPRDTAGSDMMGSVQFNSSCYYRYAVLDVDALKKNLGVDDDALLEKAVDAFVRAFVAAIPTGKQNSMAAHNFPSYVLALGRDKGLPLSLSNAFAKPVRVSEERPDLIQASIGNLERYFLRLAGDAIEPSFAVSWTDRDVDAKEGVTRVERLGELFDTVSGAQA